jgi:2,4-dichlorophenol 6-monooxygenase
MSQIHEQPAGDTAPTSSDSLDADVLVIGAGPAGLTASALLARAGVRAVTVTRYAGTADSPRAHITNQRAMEVYRDLGCEQRVKEVAQPWEVMGQQVFATSFAGRELCRMMTWGRGDDRIADYRSASPTEMCNIGQHDLEPVQLANALELGADIRFEQEVISVAQTPECATVRVRDRPSGREYELRARYVLGCDGARSIVARDGEFPMEGVAGLGDLITVWIEADLSRWTAHRSGALFFVHNPDSDDLVSVWTCVKPFTEWSTIFARFDLEPSALSEEAVMPRVRAAVGDPDVPIRIKKVSEWQINHVVAGQYRRGRLFLAGDAAHRHPPANGLGSNTSVCDSYNIAWKLALVCRGLADDALLDSYDAERRPVGRRIVDRANRSVGEMPPWFAAMGVAPGQSAQAFDANLEHLYGPDGGERRRQLREALDLLNGQFNAHGVEMGQRCESNAIVGDGTEWPAHERDADLYYQTSTHPGAPLPHAWLERDERRISTLDLCAYDRFTLLVGAGGTSWREAAHRVREETGMALEVVAVGLGLEANDVLGDWERLRETGDDGCLLIRPDRVIAWRSAGAVADPAAELSRVLTRVLRPGR